MLISDVCFPTRVLGLILAVLLCSCGDQVLTDPSETSPAYEINVNEFDRKAPASIGLFITVRGYLVSDGSMLFLSGISRDLDDHYEEGTFVIIKDPTKNARIARRQIGYSRCLGREVLVTGAVHKMDDWGEELGLLDVREITIADPSEDQSRETCY